MRQNDRIRLCHMLNAAIDRDRTVHGKQNKQNLDHDRRHEWALVKAIEIMGETASQ